MIGLATAGIVSLAYLALLFVIAWWAERRRRRGRSVVNNPIVYALSIGVYCTAWSYYGSVGLAAKSGPLFLAVYLGPSLMAFSWWIILRRIVRVSRDNNVSSIADFIAFRYGNNAHIGAIAALLMLIGIVPYIGLQLKAIGYGFKIITGASETANYIADPELAAALVLGVFGMFFGAGGSVTEKRREGLVAAVAAEGVVKLLALTAVGIYVTWGLYGGFGDIFSRMASDPEHANLLRLTHSEELFTPSWPALLALSAMAVMLLPRQFHMMVVENADEKNIDDATWMFPLYLFLMNLFVLPIAFAGILGTDSSVSADTYVLFLPLANGHSILALAAYIGGLAAATGMVLVSSVALSTIFINNIGMPIMLRIGWPKFHYPGLISNLKRLTVMVFCVSGYLFLKALGDGLPLPSLADSVGGEEHVPDQCPDVERCAGSG